MPHRVGSWALNSALLTALQTYTQHILAFIHTPCTTSPPSPAANYPYICTLFQHDPSSLPDTAILRVARIWVDQSIIFNFRLCPSREPHFTGRRSAHGHLIGSRNTSIGQHWLLGFKSSSPRRKHCIASSVSSGRAALCLISRYSATVRVGCCSG